MTAEFSKHRVTACTRR